MRNSLSGPQVQNCSLFHSVENFQRGIHHVPLTLCSIFYSAFLSQHTLSKVKQPLKQQLAMSLGNDTHTYIHETLLAVYICVPSAALRMKRGHWPNICQVFLRTALMGSINRASFCFILKYFLIRDENSDHCSLRGKTVLPGMPGSCCCVSLFAVSQETSTTAPWKIRSFPDLSPWLALCFVQMPSTQEIHLCFSLLIPY